MTVLICFLLSAVILTASAVAAFLLRQRYVRFISWSPIRFMFFGTFLAAVVMFVPIYRVYFYGDRASSFQVLLISIHNTLRLFVLDGEFDIIHDFAYNQTGWLRTAYPVLASILYVTSPLMTFGFVLTFFQNVSAHNEYILHYFSDVYIFSELTPESLALAENLKQHAPKRCVVFTDVNDADEETGALMGRVRAIGAICFKSDLASTELGFHSAKRPLNYFVIGGTEAEKIRQTQYIDHHNRWKRNLNIYLFSSSAETELALSTPIGEKTRIRRVNEVSAFVSDLLYHRGPELFQNAAGEEGDRLISIVIAGLGQYGTELLRALTWACQMPGYRVRLDVFDRDPAAESRFRALCPELMDPACNGVAEEGTGYDIRIHAGVDTESYEFAEAILALPQITEVFIALGSSDAAIRAAMRVRTLAERKHCHPLIRAIVRDSNICKVLRGSYNFRGQPYDIELIGDLETLYTEDTILHSTLEQDALQRHLKWGDEKEFWQFEYNYRSSVASAIHQKLRIACGFPWASKKEAELTDRERLALERLEHRRWSTYMRTEGYVFSGSRDRASRNDMAKMHPDIVPFAMLSEEDKRKDSAVGSL